MTTTQETSPAEPSIPSVTVRFDSFGLHPDVQRAIADLGYEQATPIQAKAIPMVLAGRDVMGAAQTGTGKTAAFTLPMIQRLLPHANTSASPARHPTRALVLTPTRELADQVAENALNYAKHTALRTAVVFGGMDMAPQTAQLRAGVEILIATPGRLLDHIQQKTANLSQVQMLVLDEADRMLDMGFLPDLQRILNLLPVQRQTLLFSATFSPEIKKLAATYLRDPVTIEVARGNATSDQVRQIIHAVPDEHKRAAIVHILDQREAQGLSRQCIIFSNSKLTCSRLSYALEKEGVKAGAIHGDKSQSERMQTLEAFKSGVIEALVATDVAARGLDIPAMPCVINFDLPYNAEDYVHRIGRTGRAGSTGDAISFVTHKDEKLLVDIEKLIKRSLPKVPLEGFEPIPTWNRQDQRAGRWGEEGGRRGRWRDDSAGRTEAHGAHTLPKVALDPFFTRPYEAAKATGSSDKQAHQAESNVPPATQKVVHKQVGALLGGLVKKS